MREQKVKTKRISLFTPLGLDAGSLPKKPIRYVLRSAFRFLFLLISAKGFPA